MIQLSEVNQLDQCLNLIVSCVLTSLRKLRSSLQQRFMTGLSISLIIVLVLFLGGIEGTSNPIACKTVAILMHYFLLVAFMWMGLIAVHLYFKFVEIFGGDNGKLVKFGLPAVFGKCTILFLEATILRVATKI